MTDIYQDIILDNYKNPKNFGQLAKTTVKHEEMNAFCGDKIRMDLKIEGDKIVDVKFSGQGCVISLAAASLLTEKIKEQKIRQVRRIKKEEVEKLLGIPLSPTRLKCAWLPWEVLQKALNKYTMEKREENGKV